MKMNQVGAACTLLLTTLSADATLVDNGGGLIYDTVLDITWAQPNNVDTLWEDANTWASDLTLGGVSGWRLPYISVAEGTGPFNGNPVDCNTAGELDCRDNELGYMFYYNLGGTAEQHIRDSGDPDLALFPKLQNASYWSGTGTEYYAVVPGIYAAWKYEFTRGMAELGYDIDVVYSWAAHDGNVVPAPAALWLFSTGLLGMIGIARRKKAA